ncbi:MAG: formylglycine-generating enzyme family protein [Bacteroidales bacterium]|nr:formylglycine-generating enzyme family protein [Bacteroidales bacterium]
MKKRIRNAQEICGKTKLIATLVASSLLLSCEHDKIEDEEEAKEVVVDAASCKSGNPLEKTCKMSFNGVDFTMIKVPAGSFLMGCQSTDPSKPNYDEVATEYEGPVHLVKMSTYAIGETEVTQGLWEAVVGQTPNQGAKQWSKKRGRGANYPAYHVSIYDICNKFLPKLNSANLLPDGYEFTLPTEAQWEYAAQGGEQSEYIRFSGSNNIDDVAWWYINGGQVTHEVKTKQPNALGIYDMTGNLWEWTSDYYDYYENGEQEDPTGPKEGVDRVIRGGSFDTGDGRSVIHARVYSDYPASRNEYLGFRLAVNKKR